VTLLEVVEHVEDVPATIDAAARRVAPGGLLVASTIDRTAKSWLFAIVGAEYLFRVLPVGTHQWRRFVRPDEMQAAAQPPACAASTCAACAICRCCIERAGYATPRSTISPPLRGEPS
jgi:ubiquinone biosynthesis O-methyltransferase